MAVVHDNRSRLFAGEKISRAGGTAALVAAVVALVGRLPALGAWWNQDDWGLLGRAAGLVPDPAVPVRWLSQTAYWRLLWPLAGLDPVPYAITRLGLHALAAAGVVRLAGRLGLRALPQWLAGLVFAASPLAFSPLYWAAGVQDLLAVCLLVWTLVRWLAPGRAARLLAAVFALGALAAKETVVGLPILLAAVQAREPASRRDGRAWILVGGLALAAAAAAGFALRHFATGAADPYAFGSPAHLLGNLVTYGCWLALPGPVYPPALGLAESLAGGAVWGAWCGWAVARWRRGHRVAAFALAGALLMLAPLLPLARHRAPDLAYPVEPFGCLALATLLPSRWRARPLVVAALVAGTMAWGFLGMRARLGLRDANGSLADPLVRRTAVSAEACRQLAHWPIPAAGLVLLQPPLLTQTAAMAEQLGEDWVTGSVLYHSLGGAVGPRLVLGRQLPVAWTNGLRLVPAEAFVGVDAGEEVRPWGLTSQALLYQTLVDVSRGLFERARLHLLRASLLQGATMTVFFDADLLPVGLDQVLANEASFLAYLDAGLRQGRSPQEIVGLRTNFQRLLDACAGRSAASPERP